MHILVTGGAGRVGRRLIPHLLARGDSVACLDLAQLPLEHPALTQVTGAFDDEAAVARAMAGAEAVVHIGAYMSWIAADVPKLYAANVTGTWTVLRAATAAKVRRFVFASSGEVYPETRPRVLPIAEDHPTEPTSAYGITKLIGEDMVAFFARSTGLETVVLRFSHTQDADELLDPESFFSGPRFYLRARIRQQQAFGNTAVVDALRPHDDGREQLLISRGQDGTVFRMPITDTRDIVAGLVAALDSPAAQPGNRGGDRLRRRGDPPATGDRPARRRRHPADPGRRLHDVAQGRHRHPRRGTGLDLRQDGRGCHAPAGRHRMTTRPAAHRGGCS